MSDKKSVMKAFKKRWKTEGKGTSLKRFARFLKDDPQAQTWFLNKKGACNQERKPENLTKARLEAQATKSARKKSKGGSKPVVKE